MDGNEPSGRVFSCDLPGTLSPAPWDFSLWTTSMERGEGDVAQRVRETKKKKGVTRMGPGQRRIPERLLLIRQMRAAATASPCGTDGVGVPYGRCGVEITKEVSWLGDEAGAERTGTLACVSVTEGIREYARGIRQ